MKNITKDNKGITLIALVITIVIMLILISVTTYTGIDTYKTSQVNKFVLQMQVLQAKVDDLVATNSLEELNSMSLREVTADEQEIINSAFNNGEISTNDASKYKVFTIANILNILDVEDVANNIMVNFETREIVSAVGIKYDEIIYYTQYKLPGGQTIINSNEITRELDFATELSVDGLNSTVTIKKVGNSDLLLITNGTLSYKEENDTYWKTITNYTETNKNYEVVISKSGNYIFRLQDNTKAENSIEKTLIIKLTNKPKTDLELEQYNYAGDSDKWAYAQKDDINYVWIPRFAYSTNAETNITEIKFTKGNSNIATDNTYIDNTWNIHDKFTTDNGIELTGIWVSVNSINQSGLNMITLLNDTTRTTLLDI